MNSGGKLSEEDVLMKLVFYVIVCGTVTYTTPCILHTR